MSPRLTVRPLAFVVGAQIDAAGTHTPGPPGSQNNCGTWDSPNHHIPLVSTWSLQPGSAPLSEYRLHYVDGFFNVSDEYTTTSATSMTLTGESICSQYSSGGYQIQAYANETDQAATYTGSADVRVYEEDNLSYGGGDPTVQFSHTGKWFAAACSCSNAGQSQTTTAASAAFTVKIRATEVGTRAALVMPRGPVRGKVTLTLDGGDPVTIDNGADTRTDRVMVWQGALSVGMHTLTITNLATPGRQRNDVDAVLLTPEPSR